MRAAERVIEQLTVENERLKTEAVWLNQFVRWVAGHKQIDGVYADAEHQYKEWVTPDGDEEDFNNTHDRAMELLELLKVSAGQQADSGIGTR
jgi:hypothetical protein